MPDTFVRTRCATCETALTFADFSAGDGKRCRACVARRPSGGIVRRRRQPAPVVGGFDAEAEEYERMLDSIPDELVDELVAALEAESARRSNGPASQVAEVLEELGIGRSQREFTWAAWGFAAGFAGNVAIAKYAQMASGAPISQFIGPLLVGGVVAGACCAAIGWGLAKLRDTPATSIRS